MAAHKESNVVTPVLLMNKGCLRFEMFSILTPQNLDILLTTCLHTLAPKVSYAP